jgi:arylsulfatase A-like enzyme
MVDTLRADRLELYGYARKTAPHLAELAREGVVMRNAHSQAGCTYPRSVRS